jgi:hemerythrin
MASADDRAPPQRAPWEAGFAVGHALIDAQHQHLLAGCNELAELCAAEKGEEGERAFDQAFERLKTLARDHFVAESAVLAQHGHADLEDHRIECDEFEYLAGEIATAENFDRRELQRFVTLWCVGHIVGSAEPLRSAPIGSAPSPRPVG